VAQINKEKIEKRNHCIQDHHHHRLYNSVRVLAFRRSRLLARLLLGSLTTIIFTVRGFQPHAEPPTWRTRVALLVWVITFDLSGKGDPASSYATAGIAIQDRSRISFRSHYGVHQK
jgi:hypothetical protein